MQYYKKSNAAMAVTHRERGDIPNILKAQDVFVEEDGYLVIKNPCKPYRPAY